MRKYIKQTGLLAILSTSEKLTDNQIISKAERLESNSADSLAMARNIRKQGGLLKKKENKLFRKQAKLLESQARNDARQADLYRKHLKLSKKFN